MIGGAKPLPDNDITLKYIYIYIYIYKIMELNSTQYSFFLGWLGAEVKILIFCYQPSNKIIIISFIYGLFEETNFNFLKFLPTDMDIGRSSSMGYGSYGDPWKS